MGECPAQGAWSAGPSRRPDAEQQEADAELDSSREAERPSDPVLCERFSSAAAFVQVKSYPEDLV